MADNIKSGPLLTLTHLVGNDATGRGGRKAVSDFATAAQGAKADTALQPATSADNITDGTTNKAFLATERTKLAGVATGATANSTDAVLLARANHTGTESADVLTDGTTNKAFLATERTKLAGVAASATANPVTSGSWTPTLSASGGTITTSSASGQWISRDGIRYCQMTATITTVGTATGSLIFSLPVAANASKGSAAVTGKETSVSGKAVAGVIAQGASLCGVTDYNNATILASGAVVTVSFSYFE
jgi:hypothetical protein